jgi:hypothetical protein
MQQCPAACLLALEVRPDLDRHSLARLVADDLDDEHRSALAEDIVVALAVPSPDGTVDPTRIVRSDSAIRAQHRRPHRRRANLLPCRSGNTLGYGQRAPLIQLPPLG